MRVEWAGAEFVGDGGKARLTIEQFEGLYDGVSPRGERTERPTGDGEFDSTMYLTGRSGAITGLLNATSPFDYEKALREIASLPFRTPMPLTAHTEEGALWISARRADAPSIQHLVYGRTARFQIPWFASDPRWYGEAQEFTGSSVTVYQRGSFEAAPIIEITGSRPSGYTVASQGRSFVVTRALSSGDTHRIDMRTGWLYENGTLVSSGVGAARTFLIPPDDPVTVTVSGGSGSMKVKVADTYV